MAATIDGAEGVESAETWSAAEKDYGFADWSDYVMPKPLPLDALVEALVVAAPECESAQPLVRALCWTHHRAVDAELAGESADAEAVLEQLRSTLRHHGVLDRWLNEDYAAEELEWRDHVADVWADEEMRRSAAEE